MNTSIDSTVVLIKLIPFNRWLKYLDLSCNELTELPDSMGSMKSLKHLFLQTNQLDLLPDALGDHHVLETLNIAENLLTELPNDIRKWRTLEAFDLSCNRLSQMPKSFKYLEMLHTFNATKNSFVVVQLPDNAPNTLKSLKISENPWRLPPVGGEDNRSLITKIYK